MPLHAVDYTTGKITALENSDFTVGRSKLALCQEDITPSLKVVYCKPNTEKWSS